MAVSQDDSVTQLLGTGALVLSALSTHDTTAFGKLKSTYDNEVYRCEITITKQVI